MERTSKVLKVAILGRPNVGKSSLFNRFIGKDKAVVDRQEGVTRDIVYGWRTFQDTDILFMDTAGFIDEKDDEFLDNLLKGTMRAVDEADLLLFVLDGRQGPTYTDEKLAELLHRSGKPVIVLINKAESHKVKEEEFQDVNHFGFQEVIQVSATHKMNIEEVLFTIMDFIREGKVKPRLEQRKPPRLRIGLIGRPNVGKSSLLNAIFGEEIAVVSEIPGTTRDAVDILLKYGDDEYLIIDTPGLRRKSRIEEPLERFSAKRSLGTIKFADLLLLVIDLSEGVTRQDKRLAGLVDEYSKGLIIVANKLDKALNTENFRELNNAKRRYELTQVIRSELSFVPWAPIVFTSAKLKFGIDELMGVVKEVERELNYEFYSSSHSELTTLKDLFHNILISVPLPRTKKGKKMRLIDAEQIGINPPTFALYFNDLPEEIPKGLDLYIQRSLRSALNLNYVPIKILYRTSSKPALKSRKQ